MAFLFSTSADLPEEKATEATRRKEEAGVVLVHGLNGSRDDMQELEIYLRARGLQVVNLLLPGHGEEDVTRLVEVSWRDWVEAVRSELQALKERCATVFLVGHSLGGALVLYVAAQEAVDGVVAMCAPLHLYSWTLPFIRLARRLMPRIRWAWEDIRDPAARYAYSRQRARQSHQWRVLAAIENLLEFLPHLRQALPAVTAPALIMVARHDHVVPPRDGQAIYRQISSHEKYLITFHHSYHLITKDYDREEVFEKTAAFLSEQAHRRGVVIQGENHQRAWQQAGTPFEPPPVPGLQTRCWRWCQQQWQLTSMRAAQFAQCFTSWAALVYTQTAKKLKP
ncbi:MAG: alpha/beta fold hydrolase [Thermogemmatispora sp.]|uniref:alpha/beta hydrolase n=1 Tax=Thermogemmatispora sp. TaxID=1968838 RepID=UPI00262B9C40|nr:alpha/beta fold hydrolase [Thermogemmatispora sp.]MBX5459100.1 alpha/beta fold hydrolase [Thermogemmatispora sp.]